MCLFPCFFSIVTHGLLICMGGVVQILVQVAKIHVSVVGSQNFGFHGVGVLSQSNFGMSGKTGVGQKIVLRSVFAHYIVSVPYRFLFIHDILVFLSLMLICYSNWREPNIIRRL